MGFKREREIIQSSNWSTSWKLGIVHSSEPLKPNYIKLEDLLLLFHLSKLLWHHHKTMYQQYKTIVQRYAPPNPNVHKANFTILCSWSFEKVLLSSTDLLIWITTNSTIFMNLKKQSHNDTLEEIFFQCMDIGLKPIAHWALNIIVILKKKNC